MTAPGASARVDRDFDGVPGTAVVTGGTGGVGSAICKLLVARGSQVVLTYRSRSDRADALVQQAPQEMCAVQSEFTSEQAGRTLLDVALERYGSVHTLIHAAGPTVPQAYLSQIDLGLFERHLLAEAASFVTVARTLLPSLRETRGAIVAVTTVANRRFPVRDVLSAAPKAAIEAAVRAIAAEEGRYGIRANCVGPGILGEGMTEHLIANGDLSDEALAVARSRIPLHHFGRAIDVAEAVCFLASPRAAYITGQFLDVDGGYSI